MIEHYPKDIWSVINEYIFDTERFNDVLDEFLVNQQERITILSNLARVSNEQIFYESIDRNSSISFYFYPKISDKLIYRTKLSFPKMFLSRLVGYNWCVMLSVSEFEIESVYRSFRNFSCEKE